MELKQTCSACPEQYDLLDDDGKQIAYFRLRHGYFEVSVPDVSGEVVYEAEPNGDGIFDDDEREFYLNAGIEAVKAHYA